MKQILIKTLLAVLLVAGACPHAACKSPWKLPGRSIAAGQLPDTVRRFIARHFANLHQFTYRSNRHFYYVCDEAGGYYLFSAGGAIRGFRFCMRQPSRQILDLLPEAAVTHIRESYPGYFLGAFLPEGEGYRAELFGADDRTLRFDGEGGFLSEE